MAVVGRWMGGGGRRAVEAATPSKQVTMVNHVNIMVHHGNNMAYRGEATIYHAGVVKYHSAPLSVPRFNNAKHHGETEIHHGRP